MTLNCSIGGHPPCTLEEQGRGEHTFIRKHKAVGNRRVSFDKNAHDSPARGASLPLLCSEHRRGLQKRKTEREEQATLEEFLDKMWGRGKECP
jgi:hypothetical protein